MGTMVVVFFPIMVFSILYLIDKNMRNSGDGFSEPIFRYITVPQGKVARIIAGIFIAIQILGTIAYTSHVFSNDFEGTIITALINICLAIVYIYINIKFLYGYRTFWLYLILFSSFLIIFNEANSSGLIWLAMTVVSLDIFFRLVIIFHYLWYRDREFEANSEATFLRFIVGRDDYDTCRNYLFSLGYKGYVNDNVMSCLTTDKLLLGSILLKASEIVKKLPYAKEDYLEISTLAASIAETIKQYLLGHAVQEDIPEELLSLIMKTNQLRFKRIYDVIGLMVVVEYGKENITTMDDEDRSLFLTAFSLLDGSNTLKNFLQQQ